VAASARPWCQWRELGWQGSPGCDPDAAFVRWFMDLDPAAVQFDECAW